MDWVATMELWQAVEQHDCEAVRRAVQRGGADVDRRQSGIWTALHKSAEAGDTELVDTLLQVRIAKVTRGAKTIQEGGKLSSRSLRYRCSDCLPSSVSAWRRSGCHNTRWWRDSAAAGIFTRPHGSTAASCCWNLSKIR